jgi:hypothetical protein
VLWFNWTKNEEVMNMALSVEDILDDLHALDGELAAFESKYQVFSEDFLPCTSKGESKIAWTFTSGLARIRRRSISKRCSENDWATQRPKRTT